jgi:hypothetical protein
LAQQGGVQERRHSWRCGATHTGTLSRQILIADGANLTPFTGHPGVRFS